MWFVCDTDERGGEHCCSDGRPTVLCNDRLLGESRRSRGRRDVTGHVPRRRRRRHTGNNNQSVVVYILLTIVIYTYILSSIIVWK